MLKIEYVKATDGYTDATVDDVSLDVEPDVDTPPEHLDHQRPSPAGSRSP